MHGYNHNTDDKAQLINDNLDIVKKLLFLCWPSWQSC